MKLCYRIFLFLFFSCSQPVFPQSTSNIQHLESGIPYQDTSIQKQASSIKHPDYRNHLNLPEYDPSLMPLKSVQSGAGVWTELNPKVPRVDYLGIHFSNKDTGWACGANGAIIKTTNGGKKWRWIENNITVVLKAVGSRNGQTVIIAGDNGTVLLSTDLGETWQTLNLNTTVNFWNVEFINENLAWLVGENGGCYKTTDGGFSWQSVSTPLGSLPHWDVSFLNASYGFICSDGGKIIRTTNGGNSWQLLQAGDDYALYTIAIADSLNISAGGVMRKFVHSSDGGNTWTQSGLAGDPYINKIVFVNDSLGYATGLITFPYRTTNQGRTWVAIGQNIGEWNITFTEGGVGFSVGNNIKITKTINSGFSWTQTIINDDFYDVYFVNETKGFAISGAFYQTTDGGINWERNYNGPGGYVITFTDSLTGFVGTSQSKIFRTTDGGQIWNLANITGLADPSGSINDIFFLNDHLGWATASKGAVMRTTDGGANWITLTNSIGGNAVQFLDSLIGFTVTGYFNKTTNGGSTWIQTLLWPPTNNLDIYFNSYSNGWYTGDNHLFHTTNGGQNWQIDPQIYTYVGNFETLSSTHFIITGSNIYESLDAGQTWNNIISQVGNGFNSLHAPENFLAFGVGLQGFIVGYLDTSFVPVELISFDSELYTNDVILKWVTASEINNLGFEIQKSQNGYNWKSIGIVPGNGTSTEYNCYTFIDNSTLYEKNYYRLKQIDFSGLSMYSNIVEVILPIIKYQLFQNYPNPFNPVTRIQYDIPSDTKVQLKVYDILGKEVKTLVNDYQTAGRYNVEFNSSNLASGVYIYQLTAKGFVKSRKMMVVK